MHELRRELWVPKPVQEVFDYFAQAENLQGITPPWLQFRILTPTPIEMKQGAIIEYALRLHGIPLRWLTEIEKWDPPFEFVDVQVKGPYKLWRHTHRFTAREGGTAVSDTVQYQLPMGALGRLVHRFQVARELSLIFDYRTERIQQALRDAG